MEITEVDRGFMVIEVPEPPFPPHRADDVYWGLSDTGNIRLTDAEVERLMLERTRRGEHIITAMRTTTEANPILADDREAAHACFTAIPTEDGSGTAWLWPRHAAWWPPESAAPPSPAIAVGQVEVVYSQPTSYERSARASAFWLRSFVAGQAQEGNFWMVGVGDDGAVRMIDGSRHDAAAPAIPRKKDLKGLTSRSAIRCIISWSTGPKGAPIASNNHAHGPGMDQTPARTRVS